LQGSSTVRALALLKTIFGDWPLNGADAQALTLRFDGALQPARLDSPLGEILGERASLQAVLNRRGQEVIIDKVVLKSETVDAVMSGQLENGVIDLNTELAADPLRVAGVVADGLTVTALMAGPIDSPQTRVTLAGDRVEMSGQMLRQVQVMADLAGLSQPTFQVTADAILAEAPLTLSVGGQYVQNQVRADQVRVTWDELIAIGSGAVDLAQIEGSSLTLDFDGRAPIVGALSGQVGYQEQILNASASVEKAVYGPIDLDQATFALTGAWPQFEGQLGFEAALPILGVETPTRGHFDLAVSALKPAIDVSGVSQVGAQEIRADAPIQIRFSDGMTAQGALSAFGGGIAFTYDASGVTPSEVTLSALSLSEFGPLLLRPSLRGTLEGAAQLQISEGGLSGSARATIFDLARGLPDTPSADLSLNAILVENRLNAEVRAKDADETLDLVADFATTLQHKGHLPSIRLADGARTPLRLIGGGPIAPLWGLAAPPDLRLDGDFNVDINNGVGDTFRFTGPLRFENGAFEDGFTGIYLKSIVVDAQLKQSGIDVRSATANGANNGSLSASGAYLFDGSGAVTLRLNRLDAFNRSDISATVSGDAQIDRQNRRTRILGDLTLDQARVNVANLPGSGYTTIEVEFSDQSDEDEDEGPTREAILLDLGIKADRRIFVSGLGVDSEWSADLRVSGSAGQPRLIGRANLVRGEADLLSRRFELSEGVLRFIGAPEETEVSLAAERTEDGITSAISLNGNVMDPEITLSSDPALPDDEILARVLFGRSPSQLSPLQAAQLAGAAAQLAGGDAINLMGRLEAATGLDRLDIGFDDDGAATLATGKYLADDIYLEVESGVSGAPGVALEWTPLDNLAVDAEIDPELGPKVAIQWKRDFDRLPFEDEAE
ncbi:MAG: translocation/assembly module TamB domain-containing protein, partial [Pseudomonadota bacterium]